MKKIYTMLLIIICLICFTGCGNKKTESSNYKDTYTHKDLIVNTAYEKINDYLNTLFNELDFDGKMKLTSSNENETYYTLAYINEKADTVFTFYFDKEQEFMFVNIIYDKYNDDSIDLAKEVIRYSKFNFNMDELASIRKILTTSEATDNTEIGNYIISNLSSGNLTIKSKEKYSNNKTENKVEKNSNNNTTKNESNNNSKQNSTNNNTNSNNQTNTQSNKNSNTQQNTQQQTQPENNTPSVSKQNALKKAQSYLSHSAFSRKELIEQLEYEKYSNEDATYAVDNVRADWNAQALKKAQSYLSHSAFSRKGLIEQLEYEGFTSEQANYGVNNVGVDWNAQAVKKAQSYLSHSAFSKDGLIEQLEYEGFTHDQAVYGVTQNGL